MKKFLVLFAILAGLTAATPSFAALQVDVNQGNIQPLPIAIPDFLSAGGDPQSGPNIAGVVVGRALYDGRIDPAEALAKAKQRSTGS